MTGHPVGEKYRNIVKYIDMWEYDGTYMVMSSLLSSFAPVPRAAERHDGWTPERQRGFIAALCEYGSVRAAAEKVGMKAGSAYRLRASDGAAEFAAAWDEALKVGWAQLTDIAMDRAVNGVAVPHFYKGEKVGERIWYDNKLLMFMLRQTNTRRFGPHAADYDFADEARVAEKSAFERRLEVIRKAEEMIENLQEMLDYDDTSPEDESLGREERDKISERIMALHDHVDNLKHGLPSNANALAMMPIAQPRQPWSHSAAWHGSG
jgi:hypothetical protein